MTFPYQRRLNDDFTLGHEVSGLRSSAPVAGDVCCPGCRRRRSLKCGRGVEPLLPLVSMSNVRLCIARLAARPAESRCALGRARPAGRRPEGMMIFNSRFGCSMILCCLGSAEEPARGSVAMDHLVFDTRYTGSGFVFESAEFPQGNVVAAVGWAERRGVAHLVRSVCQTGAVAVLLVRVAPGRRARKPSASSVFSISSRCDVRPRLGAVLLPF